MITAIQSKREFKVITVTNKTHNETYICRLTEIMDVNSDSESFYSMQEIIDDIMDLKAGDSMYFQPCRDDNNSKGIIIRVE